MKGNTDLGKKEQQFMHC